MAVASQNPCILILASRTRQKIEAVAAKIKSAYPQVKAQVVILDLASQESIRRAAEEVLTLIPKLDLLINNAGSVNMSRQWTKERIEIQFGANHIGHFLFTKLLLPLLERAAKSSPSGETRIVNLSSQGHRLSPIRFHDYNIEGKEVPPEEAPFSPMPPAFSKALADGYMPIVAYGQSKTANILFTMYLQEHLSARGIASYAVHPGG
jgi:NAD(P)-dependent dehydrogenase (short-subunit alcohol dehydrogenase family)